MGWIAAGSYEHTRRIPDATPSSRSDDRRSLRGAAGAKAGADLSGGGRAVLEHVARGAGLVDLAGTGGAVPGEPAVSAEEDVLVDEPSFRLEFKQVLARHQAAVVRPHFGEQPRERALKDEVPDGDGLLVVADAPGLEIVVPCLTEQTTRSARKASDRTPL